MKVLKKFLSTVSFIFFIALTAHGEDSTPTELQSFRDFFNSLNEPQQEYLKNEFNPSNESNKNDSSDDNDEDLSDWILENWEELDMDRIESQGTLHDSVFPTKIAPER